MYEAVNIQRCRELRHRLRIFWSDKTPLKVNVLCLDCSSPGVTAVAAYGRAEGSWGLWRRREKEQHDV